LGACRFRPASFDVRVDVNRHRPDRSHRVRNRSVHVHVPRRVHRRAK
jgi:hypothetical protein